MTNVLNSKYIKGLLLTPILLASQAALANDIATLKLRIAPDYAQKEVSIAQSQQQTLAAKVAEYRQTQQADGSWADIDYGLIPTSEVPIRAHLSRMRALAAGDYLNLDPNADQAAIQALYHWYSADRTNKNWWWNEIGKQLYLGPIAMMLGDKLPSDLVAKMAADMPTEPYETGANRTDISKGVIFGGLLANNMLQVGRGLGGIEETIVVTSAEGVQADYSFQQHGPQLYTGGYGEVFFDAAAYWAYQVRDLSWQFAPDKVDVLTDYFLDGVRWMNSRGTLDYNARGRGISRKVTPNLSDMLLQTDYVAALSPQRSADAMAFKQHIQGGPSGLNGFKSFWRSDYATKVGSEHFIGIKMNSARIVPTEAGNGENLLGYWLGFGSTFIMQRGDEYHNLFPVWDWSLIPGVTAPHYQAKPADWGRIEQQTTFVGGVDDGKRGVAVMDMDFFNTQAKKAWFSFDDEVVALGAGIRSTRSEYVSTTVNQTRLNGPVTVDGVEYPMGSRQLVGANWVHHDGVGYVFPTNWYGHMDNQTRTGSWQAINQGQSPDIVSDDVFMLRIGHSWQPNNASYQYVIVPNQTADQTRQYAQSHALSVLSNTTQLQAVHHQGIDVTGIVFHNAGSLDLPNGDILSVDKPSVVLVDQSGPRAKITLATPGVGTYVQVTLSEAMNMGSRTTVVATSSDIQALGKSVLVDFDAPAVIAPINVNVAADGFVRDGSYQNSAFGANSYLMVKKDGVGYSRKVALTFDFSQQLPSLTNTPNSSKAVLKLHVENVGTDATRTITIAPLARSDWQESSLTWASFPALASVTSVASVITPSDKGTWLEVDVSALLTPEVRQAGCLSVVVENRGAASAQSDVSFSSRESGLGAQLVITP